MKGPALGSQQTPTQVCPTCGDTFFTRVGLDEHVQIGQHNQTTRRWVGGVSPTLRENGLRVAALNNSRRRRCDACGLVSTPAALGIHQKAIGHRLVGNTMRDRPLLPCPVKGCAWRGSDPDACPMHASDEAWERQPSLLPEHIVIRRLTRHR